MSTISDGVDTVTPILIDGYEATRESRNVVHVIIGTPEPAVTLRPAGPRRGTLTALFATRADALAAEAILAADDVLTFADPDVPSLSMTFVVDGDVTVGLDDETRALWTVAFSFLEVTL